MHRRLSLTIAVMALIMSIAVFAGSVLQTGLLIGDAQAQSSVRPPDNAANTAPANPGETREVDRVEGNEALPGQTVLDQQGRNSSATLWGDLRHGGEATVSIPDKKAAVLVQDEGMGWLEWRAKGGPLQNYGGQALLIIAVLLVLFFLIRGRVRIKSGPSGTTIERLKAIERFAHWVLAISFILLALTGLNLLYGKDYLMPLIGKDAFATITMGGKWVHNNVAWAFMFAIVLVFLMWVRHNLPSLLDLKWFAQGGGIIGSKHPPAKKFNAGQKLIFWSVILLGASISASGISLLFPYEAPMFAKTFAVLNDTGIGPMVWGEALPTTLTPIEEMMYAQLWHTIIAFAMIFIIVAHIYIGSVGMEGAFAAMGSGHVDRNWANEHHGLWVKEEDAKSSAPPQGARATPAE